jgi:hypothetical protein
VSKPSGNDSPGLAQFLAEEVREPYYADLLLERAEAAGQGKPAPNASGDAYNVTFGPQETVIEHHYLEGWRPVRVSHKDFVAAVRKRRREL